MHQTVSLLKDDFFRLSEFIHAEYGIKMPPVKKTLLESRLQKRLRKLEIRSFKEYCNYLFSPEGRDYEIPHFIDKITTNKTDFFREADHFEYLVESVVPEMIRSWKGIPKNLKVWSAGCSTGEEPYTLAMVLKEFADKTMGVKPNISILATDISMEVLRTAKRAVYHEMRVAPVPMTMRKKYLLRSRDKSQKVVRIAPELRKLVQFGRLNFMDRDFGFKSPMDIVFCRNVVIYFDKHTQQDILSRLCRHLVPGGYFFQGHSESVQGMDLPLEQVQPTIYRKT
ncbi:MAG: protein-glutamate O-methyltransferase [Proteobacteria bacterium]|nr:protein-glutamate O-methyltransferase [Pseudomonadota bacterium]